MNDTAGLGMTAPVADTEEAFAFGIGDDSLIGLLHRAATSRASSIAVLVVVGGPQYRAGSHRQFLLLARRLAGAGIATLRFDVRGMGDSSGAQRSFEELSDDIAAAIDQLQRRLPELKQVVLWGLCDGASAALLYLHERRDPRVGALCLLNPWVRSSASLARTHVKHYYRQRLMQRGFWLKLLSGGVAWKALRGLVANLRAARSKGPVSPVSNRQDAFQKRMADAWLGFDGPLMLVLSGNDYTAREFEECVQADPAWRGALQRPRLSIRRAESADHTFSNSADAQRLEDWVIDWIEREVAPGAPPAAGPGTSAPAQNPLQCT